MGLVKTNLHDCPAFKNLVNYTRRKLKKSSDVIFIINYTLNLQLLSQYPPNMLQLLPTMKN